MSDPIETKKDSQEKPSALDSLSSATRAKLAELAEPSDPKKQQEALSKWAKEYAQELNNLNSGPGISLIETLGGLKRAQAQAKDAVSPEFANCMAAKEPDGTFSYAASTCIALQAHIESKIKGR